MSPLGRDSYLDTCVLVSLFHNDAGYGAAEHWLARNPETALWISHWVLLEFASATALRSRRHQLGAGRATRIHGELEVFRRERLSLVEPCGADFEQACGWLVQREDLGLRGGDALHLAVAHRHGLEMVSADQTLVAAAPHLGIKARLVTAPAPL
jgi:predicted nucleic acid-binding protein